MRRRDLTVVDNNAVSECECECECECEWRKRDRVTSFHLKSIASE
jgi:hypothetical protein